MRQATIEEIKELPYQDPFTKGNLQLLFCSMDDQFILSAKKNAEVLSLDKNKPNGTVLVKDDVVIGNGANGSDYHLRHQCERVRLGIPTGQGYELCEGCHPKNHGEPKAIKNALDQGNDPRDADLYLWGHWWFCESCCKTMIEAGIKRVILPEGAKKQFGR